MAQLFEIEKVTIGPRTFEALVEASPSAPLLTSEDPAGTQLVLDLMPELGDHVCLGDSAPRFGDVVEQTELAHLLEHVSVELLARTNVAGDIASGQTVETGERRYRITFACPDDVLVAGALSSAVWILQWAYSGGGDPRPDVDAIASGLADLVSSLDDATETAADASAPQAEEPSPQEDGEPAAASEITSGSDFVPEAASDLNQAPGDGPESGAEPAPAAESNQSEDRDRWDMDNVPRPHLVR